MTTAIVPASGTPRTSAASPTTTPLKAATNVTPRKYPRSDVITDAEIVRATGRGKSDMAVYPVAHLWTVLEQEERSERSERQPEQDRGRARGFR